MKTKTSKRIDKFITDATILIVLLAGIMLAIIFGHYAYLGLEKIGSLL